MMDSVCRIRAADGAEIAYRRWAPGSYSTPTGLAAAPAPVLFLHGAASNGSRWWRFVGCGRMARERLLLRPDLRGSGQSVWRGPAGMEAWCADLAELLRHEGRGPAFVVGHCLGANLALHFAARNPRLCAGLVLVEPMPAQALVGVLARLRRWLPLMRVAVAGLRALNRIGLYRRRLEPLDLEVLDRSVQHGADPAAGQQALRRRYGSPWHDIRTLPSAQYLNNLIQMLRPLPLAQVHCPCLAVLSTGRLMADPARVRAALAGLGEVALAEVDAQHWIPTEQPEALCTLIDDWLEAQSRG